jgi:hypothetical protein
MVFRTQTDKLNPQDIASVDVIKKQVQQFMAQEV